MFSIVHHDSASISPARLSSPSNNADSSCVHGLGRKDTPSEGEIPLALGTSLFLGTVMDMLVLERAPLGAIRNRIWTRRGATCFPEAPNISLLGAPEEFRQRIERDPGKLPC